VTFQKFRGRGDQHQSGYLIRVGTREEPGNQNRPRSVTDKYVRSGSLAPISKACKSATPCCAVVGVRTGVEAATVLSFRVVPGRFEAHTCVELG